MLREQINCALKQALANGHTRRANTLRLITVAIQDRCAALGANGEGGISDAEVVELLQRMVAQRRETVREYEQAGRLALAQQELDEIEILQCFLPEQFDEPQTWVACQKVVQEIGASGLKDVGRTMNTIKARYKNRMNFARAGQLVRQMLR